jgi:hypothetical protein
MDEGKILLVNLSPQLEEMSRLVGSMLIGKLLMASFSRVDVPEAQRRQFNIYVDEFQRFATSEFRTFIEEARKFRVSVTIAHQSLSQIIEEANRTAATGAGTMVVCRVSGEDSKVLAKSYNATPTREIVGEEPVRAPTSDVIGHLLSRGHNNPLVAKFITDYLSRLESLVKHVAFSHNLEFGCCLLADGGFVEHGKRLLNNTLYQCMLTGRSNMVIPPMALFILGGAADDGITEVFRQYMRYSQQYFNGFTPDANCLGHPSFLTNEPALKGFLKHYARRRFWDSVLSYRIVTPGPSCVRMLTTLRQTMAILAQEPILVDTGQYQPKYQQRTYADMENQIANDLSQLQNFTARVKLVTGEEHVIRTHPAPQGLSVQALAGRISAIKDRMNALGYTRYAPEVEKDVRDRHERLRQPTEEPPPTRARVRRAG